MARFLGFTFMFLLLCGRAAVADAPLTFDEAQAMALEKIPGEITEKERSLHNGAIVYEFTIEKEDGMVMEIEIDSVTRDILELKVSKLLPGAALPEPTIGKEAAEEKAALHIRETMSGLRPVKIVEAVYTIIDGRLVYVVDLERGIKKYRVVVDANTGEIVTSDIVR